MKERTGKLGQGAYGCVYNPPIPCVGRTAGPAEKELVGKIFGREDLADDEERIMGIVAELDPEGRFTVSLRSACRVASTKSLKADCSHAREASGNRMKQLIYEHKGVDLCNFMKEQSYDILDHLEGIKNVAGALCVLSSAEYAHRDLKPPNIMMHEGTMYLADFGLLIPFDRLYEEQQDYVLAFDYEYYPPEFKIYYDLKIANSPISNISDVKAFMVNDVRANYAESENVLRLKAIEDTVSGLVDSFGSTSVLEATLRLNASKVDIFGFGMTFMKMFMRSKKTSQTKSMRKKLHRVLERCVDPNPFTRVGPKEAVRELSVLTKLIVKR